MKFTGFVSSCVGKALLIVFCILLGVVLAVGGEALAGYIVLTREGMVGTLGDALQNNLGEDSGLKVQFDDETRAMSLLTWGTSVLGAFTDLDGNTVGGLEKLIGLNVLSNTIEEIVGIDDEIIQASSISEIGKTITNNLTLALARDKFGVSFPEMPLFEDEEFLAKPISEAFSDFDEFTIGEIISLGDDANVILKKMENLKINELGGSKVTDIVNDTKLGEVITIDEHSNAVLQKLKDVKIGDLGGSTTTDTINDMELGEVIDIDEHSNAVLQELQHVKIGDLGKSATDETIKGMFLCELMTIDDSSPKTLKSLKYATIESQYEVYPDDDTTYPGQKKDGKDGRALVYATKEIDGVERQQKGISETMEELKLGDAIEINAGSHAVLRELATTKITDLGGSATNDTVNGMFMDQLMTIDDSSPEILKNIRYACIESQYEDDPDNPGQKLDGKGGRALVYKTKNYGGVDRPLKGISETIDTLYVKDVVEITESSSAILRKMRTPTQEEIDAGKGSLFGTSDMLVSDLGGQAVIDLIDDTTIGEIVEIDGSSEPIMQALENTKIGGLNSRIQTLKLREVFDTTSLEDGALSLLDPDTTLPDIPLAVTNVMLNATVATMVGKGVIDSNSMNDINNLKAQQRAFMYNSTISDMLSGVIAFINDPYTLNLGDPDPVTIKYQHVSPTGYTVAQNTFASLTEFVATYAQYGTVDLPATVTVTVDATADAGFYNEDEECYIIPIFNVKSSTAFTVSGGTVKLGVYDTTTDVGVTQYIAQGAHVDPNDGTSPIVKYLALSRNQYGFAFVNNGSTGYLAKAFTGIIFAPVAASDIE